MKIAVISKDYNDFLNHKKYYKNKYIYISSPEMTCGNVFDKIEIAPRGKKNKQYLSIKGYCEFRMKNVILSDENNNTLMNDTLWKMLPWYKKLWGFICKKYKMKYLKPLED
jgi:hypothetical protein